MISLNTLNIIILFKLKLISNLFIHIFSNLCMGFMNIGTRTLNVIGLQFFIFVLTMPKPYLI